MRVILLGIGLLAVLLGGTRSGLLILIVSVLSLLAIRLRFGWLTAAAFSIGASLLTFHFIGETVEIEATTEFSDLSR